MKTIALAILLCTAPAASAQKLAFDVAALHQNKTGLPPTGTMPDSNVPLGPGDVYSPTGGRLSIHNYPFISFVAFAYKMTDGQREAFLSAAPHWAGEDRFDLQARTDKPAVTKDELREMMKSLLAERFSMSVHYEDRIASVYAVQLVKPGTPGPRLRPHPPGECSRAVPGPEGIAGPAQSEAVPGGYPAVCGGLLMLPDSNATHFHIGARDVPFAIISNAMAGWGDLHRPIVNQTGLTGMYDFALDYNPRGADVPTPPGETEQPGFMEAIKAQLGLRLDSQKQPVPILVVDHIERPSEN